MFGEYSIFGEHQERNAIAVFVLPLELESAFGIGFVRKFIIIGCNDDGYIIGIAIDNLHTWRGKHLFHDGSSLGVERCCLLLKRTSMLNIVSILLLTTDSQGALGFGVVL